MTSIVNQRGVPVNSPVGWCATLGRRMRLDGPGSIGVSTQTCCEDALERGEFAVAADLAEYFSEETVRINEALYTWLVEILDSSTVVAALRDFRPGAGDLAAVRAACERGDATVAKERLELMRVRIASLHDALVWWIQNLLADLASKEGDDAVFDQVMRTYERLWKERYVVWNAMTPLERLQLSVEGMRGHLSGPRHRGDVGVIDEVDRFVMVLDPCGSCGVLRRGDPDSGRPPCAPAGTTTPHPWSWNRVGLGWYAVHSAIVMEYHGMSSGGPPMRPLENCDTTGPCRWYIYKEPGYARAEHYEGMGFS